MQRRPVTGTIPCSEGKVKKPCDSAAGLFQHCHGCTTSQQIPPSIPQTRLQRALVEIMQTLLLALLNYSAFFVVRPLGSQDELLQTRILWLVGRCPDRPSRALPLTCPNVKTCKQTKKMKRNAGKKTRRKKEMKRIKKTAKNGK